MARINQQSFRRPLRALLDEARDIELTVAVDGPAGLDCRCAFIGARGQLGKIGWSPSGPAVSADGAVEAGRSDAGWSFAVGLTRLGPEVEQLLVYLVHQGGAGGAFNLRASVAQDGERLSLALSGSLSRRDETVHVLQFYRIDGLWNLSVPEATVTVAPPAPAPRPAPGPTSKARPEAEPRPDSKSAFDGAAGDGTDDSKGGTSPDPVILDGHPDLAEIAKDLGRVLDELKISLDGKARVALVMDITVSMDAVYREGAAQEAVNRLVPLACRFDKRGELDLWFYADRCRREAPVGIGNYQTVVPKDKDYARVRRELGSGNNEPVVMTELIETYGQGKVPAMMIFLSDARTTFHKEMDSLLLQASKRPIFWQFAGLGESESNFQVFDIAEKNNYKRHTSNVGFFDYNDYASVPNKKLFERLLVPFSKWLQEAKSKGYVS